MNTHTFLRPDPARDELLAAYPDLSIAVERAQHRAEEMIAQGGLSGRRRQQFFADAVRAALCEELTAISEVPGDVVEGPRNSICLHPRGQRGVRIRVLKARQSRGLPGSASRRRQQEFSQEALELGVVPDVITLALTWRMTKSGLELDLQLPVNAGRGRRAPDAAWRTAVPVTPDIGDEGTAGVARPGDDGPDLDHDDDDLGIRPRQDEQVDKGDDPA